MSRRLRGMDRVLICKLLWACPLLSIADAGCAPREFVGGRGEICVVGTGTAASDVLDRCGIPDGLRYQPKVSEGIFRPRVCSAPVYVYPGAMVSFGCSGGVSDVSLGNPPEPSGVQLGVEALEAEIVEDGHKEAAVIGLLELDPANKIALDLISSLERNSDSISKETVVKARKLMSARPQ